MSKEESLRRGFRPVRNQPNDSDDEESLQEIQANKKKRSAPGEAQLVGKQSKAASAKGPTIERRGGRDDDDDDALVDSDAEVHKEKGKTTESAAHLVRKQHVRRGGRDDDDDDALVDSDAEVHKEKGKTTESAASDEAHLVRKQHVEDKRQKRAQTSLDDDGTGKDTTSKPLRNTRATGAVIDVNFKSWSASDVPYSSGKNKALNSSSSSSSGHAFSLLSSSPRLPLSSLSTSSSFKPSFSSSSSASTSSSRHA